MGQVHQNIRVKFHKRTRHIGTCNLSLCTGVIPDGNIAVHAGLNVHSLRTISGGIDALIIGTHMAVHLNAPPNLQTAVLQESDVHPHTNAYRHKIRRKPAAVLHHGG